MKRYVLAPVAARDLAEIWRYLKRQSSKETADRIESMIREKMKGWQSTVIQTFVEELADFVAEAKGEPHSGRLAVANDGLRAVQIAHATYESEASRERVRLPTLS